MADVRGHDGVDALIAGAQEQFAGLTFSPGEVLDAHHDVVRFTWHLGPARREPVVIGFDVAEVAEDGRLERVHGFLDRVPGLSREAPDASAHTGAPARPARAPRGSTSTNSPMIPVSE